jgi:HAD superfamily hydrolase (TIGR01549 family)
MKKYEILLFDLDDTLIDNVENIRHAFKEMLNYMDELYSDEKFERWYQLDKNFWQEMQEKRIIVPDEYREPRDLMVKWVRSQRYILYFNNKISLEKAMNLNDLYLDALNEIVIPIDYAKEVLEYLSQKYIIVVATNGPSVATESKLKKIGCFEYVNYIMAADMFGHMKPAIQFFDGVKERLKVFDSDKYLVIGDSLRSDVEGAKNANMDSCWFNRGEDQITNKYTPTMIIDNLKQLKHKL